AEMVPEPRRVAVAHCLDLSERDSRRIAARSPPDGEDVGEGEGAEDEEAPAQPRDLEIASARDEEADEERGAEDERAGVAAEEDEALGRVGLDAEGEDERQEEHRDGGDRELAAAGPLREVRAGAERGDEKDGEHRRARLADRGAPGAGEGGEAGKPGGDRVAELVEPHRVEDADQGAEEAGLDDEEGDDERDGRRELAEAAVEGALLVLAGPADAGVGGGRRV